MSSRKQHLSLKTLLTLVFYLIIPLCSLLLILQVYPELPKDRFYMRIYWVLPTATVIIILAQLSTRYQKGDTRRFLLNIGFTATTMIWMVGLLGGGVVIPMQWNEYEFSLHMENYIVLIICVAALNMMYYTLEWRMYRKDNTFHLTEKEIKTSTIIK
jgi:hypothetical protein